MQRWLHFAGCLVLPTSLVVVGVAWCLAWYANVRPKMAAPPEIVVLASDQIQDKVCNNVVQIAESSIKDHGFFSVGVSGGSLAKLLCTGLKSRPGIGKKAPIHPRALFALYVGSSSYARKTSLVRSLLLFLSS